MNRALREITADSRQALHLPGLGKVSPSLGPIIQVARNTACPFHPVLIRDRIGETDGKDSLVRPLGKQQGFANGFCSQARAIHS